MNIKLLDCTLRDGGYVNDWAFKDTQSIKIINSLTQANIDIIECGYLTDTKGKVKNSTLFNSLASIDSLLKDLNTSAQKVAMINLYDYDIEKLAHKESTLLDGIRLAFHKQDQQNALLAAEKIIKRGYRLFLQPMITTSYKDIEFLSLIENANMLDISSFYIVDSFGSMSLEQFTRYMILADNNLKKKISLGYHSHNNMQLAFSNAVNMCNANLKRDLIIDSSIYGIGRGAGNLNSELIADYLNKRFDANYKTLPLLETIDKFLSSLMNKKSWGFSPAQYLSAFFNCHPNYATYLINKNTNHIVGVKEVLSKIPNEQKSSYDEKLIEKLYISFLLETRTPPVGKLEISDKKQVLLVASGKSLQDAQHLIDLKLKDDNYVLIALNHIPSFECDYYLFSNQKRYDEFGAFIPFEKLVITTNVSSSTPLHAVLDIKPLSYTDNLFVMNVAIITLNYLISIGKKRVEIIGLDGYDLNKENYNYNETSMIKDEATLLEQNRLLALALTALEKKIVIELLTPSKFKKEMKLRILGVIPARFKSSRFEGKPLCMINNIPMIKRTYLQAKKSTLLDHLIVATDDKRISNYCLSENIPVIMTSENCLTGTDRIAQVAQQEHYDLYVNIQGDEPVIDPKSIDEVVSEYKKYRDHYIAYNLYKHITDKEEIAQNTIIKVIVNEKDELLYMSRLGIPFNKSKTEASYKKQVCVYGFTKQALELFSSQSKTVNEKFEDIEILRFVDLGYKVKMKETSVNSIAVDIPDDVKKVEKFLKQNKLK